MAKKEKEKPVLNLDGKEYVIENMTDEQKMMVNHINDIQNKQASNSFDADQLRVGRDAFVKMLKNADYDSEYCSIFLYKVRDPSNFGIAEVDIIDYGNSNSDFQSVVLHWKYSIEDGPFEEVNLELESDFFLVALHSKEKLENRCPSHAFL